MEKTIIGFQFDPVTGRYIGEYEFPNNLDQEDIHLPPNTTLERPPVLEVGKIAVRVNDSWQIQNDPFAVPKRPKIDNYLMITEEFISILESQGQWTDEDRAKRAEAVAEAERIKAAAEAAAAAKDGSAA